MSEETDAIAKLSEKTWIPIGLAVTILVGGIALSTSLSSRLVRIESQIETLTREVHRVQEQVTYAGSDRWRREDMRAWAALLQARNPELKIPEPR